MTQAYDYEARALDALKRAVVEALERSAGWASTRWWREDRAVCIGPDAPGGVAEPGKDD